MSFEVGADAYGRFMGRYSEKLAAAFVEVADLHDGQRALDVGCGPGAQTAQLVDRLGVDHVAAVDPSDPFVDAARARFPGLEVRTSGAEELPFPDASFDATMAQLVVQFMTDPVGGLREMGRVTRPGGVVAACVWDAEEGGSPLALFWGAVRSLDPSAATEVGRPGTGRGDLERLATEAGFADVVESKIEVVSSYATFAEWWEPYTLGVGPAGAHLAGLDEEGAAALRSRCEEMLPPAPFDVHAQAWCVRATVD
jgi:SAM-dependent methyltransferase